MSSYLNNLLRTFGFYNTDLKNSINKTYSTHNGNTFTNLKSRTKKNVNGHISTEGRDFYNFENETYEKN